MTGDDFRHDAGPFLLGALDEPERSAFEAHLQECRGCRDEVAQLRPLVAMLAAVAPEDAATLLGPVAPEDAVTLLGPEPAGEADPEPVPDTLWPSLLARAARRTRRRRTLLGVLGAVAAAAVITATVVLAGQPAGVPPVQSAEQVVVMDPVGTTAVSATATVTSEPWGTEITLRCHYQADGSGTAYPAPGAPAVYLLRVTDDAGTAHEIGSWTLSAGQQVVFTGGTAVPRNDIRRIEVLAADGTPVLTTTG